jgi:hypothetical protein
MCPSASTILVWVFEILAVQASAQLGLSEDVHPLQHCGSSACTMRLFCGCVPAIEVQYCSTSVTFFSLKSNKLCKSVVPRDSFSLPTSPKSVTATPLGPSIGIGAGPSGVAVTNFGLVGVNKLSQRRVVCAQRCKQTCIFPESMFFYCISVVLLREKFATGY